MDVHHLMIPHVADWFLAAGPASLVPGGYQWPLVLLSLLVAAAGSGTALYIASAQQLMASPRHRWLALSAATLALGGAIWSMHFIGMLAFELCASVRYDPAITVLSSLPAFAAAAVALRALEHGRLGPRRLLASGLCMGAGIGAMHYSGMLAMTMAPALRFDPWLFALSVVAAVTLATLALWVREFIARLGGAAKRLRHALGGLVMGAAITAMHYIGMAAARFVGTAESAVPVPAEDRWLLTWMIAMGAFGLVGVVFSGGLLMRLRLMLTQLRLRERELRTIFQNAIDAIVTTNDKGQVQSVNHSFEWMFGMHTDQILGRDVHRILPEWPSDAGRSRAAADDFSGVESHTMEVRAVRADGSELPLRLSLVRITERGQQVQVGFLMDITDIKQREAAAEHQAHHDPLTGLCNRTGALRALHDTLAAAPYHAGRLGVLFIDVDGFKQVNDGLGHAAGDRVLVEVGRRIRGCIRHSDLAARLGGDEFLVLLRELPDAGIAQSVAAKILEAVCAPVGLEQGEVRVGCSIGLAMAVEADGQPGGAGRLIERADLAMYEAKRLGKGQVRQAEPVPAG
ncbi:MHYT domain-containing protein [Ramlibacter sp. MAHUQ-53]